MAISSKKVKARLREPSTWASISAASAAILAVDPNLTQTIALGTAAILQDNSNWPVVAPAMLAAILGIVLPEQKAAPEPESPEAPKEAQ